MKIKIVLYIVYFFLIGANAFSQIDTVKPMFKISSFSLGFGLLANQSPAISQSDYKKIAPNNSLVNADLTGYTNSPSLIGNGYFNLNIGFNGKNKKTNTYNLRREYRVGFRFYSEDILSVTYDKSGRFDSSQINSLPYASIDSSKSYNYNITTRTFMFDFGTIYQSNPKFLLTGYVGYNIGLGANFSSVASAFLNSDVIIRSGSSYKYNSVNSKIEETPLRNSIVANATVVWGACLRLSKTKKFWSKCMLNIEGRFGVNSQNIPNYKNFTRMVISSHFGFKFLL